MEIILTESTRGKSLLVIDKFTFYKQKELKNGEIFWRCTKKSSNCGAKVFTVGTDNKISRSQLVHNHEPDFSRVNRQILFNACKRKAHEDIAEKPSKIVNSELAKDLPVTVTSKDISYIKRNIYNSRQKVLEETVPSSDEDEEEEELETPNTEPQTSEVTNTKWQNIRDAFIKSLKKISEQPSANKYLYYDNLKFLIKIIQKDDAEMEKGTKSGTESPVNENCNLQKKSQMQEDMYQEILKELRNSKTQPDEDEAFFMSVVPSVRKLSDENKLEFRMGVLQLLKDLNNKGKDTSAMSTILFHTTNSSTSCHPTTSFTHYPSPNTNGMTCCHQPHLS